MELEHVLFASIALLISVLFLLAISPSRALGMAAAAVAMAAGLSGALWYGNRPIAGPVPAAPMAASAKTDAPASTGSYLESRMQAENDRLRALQTSLEAQKTSLEAQNQKIGAMLEAQTREIALIKSSQQQNEASATNLRSELAQVKSRLGTEAAERQRLENANRDVGEALKKAETALAQEQATRDRSTPGLGNVTSAPALPAAVEPAVTPAPPPQAQSSATPVKAAVASVAELDKSAVPPQPAAMSPPGAAAGDVPRQQLDTAGLVTPQFSLKLLPSNELVAGRTGSYYGVTLVNPATGKPFMFEKERYVLADRDADFVTVATAMQSRLATIMPAAVVRTFFVRSFAASGAFAQSRAIAPERSSLNRIKYLPAVPKSDGLFQEPPAEQVLTGPFQANHLPLLRAANVRELLVRSVKGPVIEILAGEVVPASHPQAQTFELILLAVWP